MNAPLNVACRDASPVRENAQEKKSLPTCSPRSSKGWFISGMVPKREALLNYHCQDGQMQFLNPRAGHVAVYREVPD